MTNRKCKIFSIFLALTLVLASVGVAFADYGLVDGYTLPASTPAWLYSNGGSYQTYTSGFFSIDCVSRRFSGLTTKNDVLMAVPNEIDVSESHIALVTFSGHKSMRDTLYFSPSIQNVNSVLTAVDGCHLENGDVVIDADDFTFMSRATFSAGGVASSSYAMPVFRACIVGNYTNDNTFNISVDEYLLDDVVIYGDNTPPSPIETFSFTVPYGSDLKITGQDIETVLVRASTTKRGTLGNYLQKFNLSDIRYSAASDFEKSIPVPLKGTGKTSLTGGYSDFAGYCVPSNSFTIYNRVGNSNNISVDVYVNVTGRNIKGVYYSPQTNQDILDGVSSPTSENGDFAVTGGSGTPEDPYVTNPVNDDGVPIPYDALTPVIDNSPSDGVQNELLNRLDSIFAIPSRVASSVSGWIAGLAQLTTALYSAFPPVITDLFVAFFSIVVLIGLVKMFL